MGEPRDIARFFSKVLIPADKSLCWSWTAGVDVSGYGVFWSKGRNEKAHRFSWTAANRRQVPAGKIVRHKCDNRQCCNPEHLLIGTYSDNSRDMVQRCRSPRGERTPRARLTEISVELIRARLAAGEPGAALAARFGVSASQISNIKHGRQWVPFPEA